VLIAQAVLILEHGQTDRCDWMPYPTPAAIQPARVTAQQNFAVISSVVSVNPIMASATHSFSEISHCERYCHCCWSQVLLIGISVYFDNRPQLLQMNHCRPLYCKQTSTLIVINWRRSIKSRKFVLSWDKVTAGSTVVFGDTQIPLITHRIETKNAHSSSTVM